MTRAAPDPAGGAGGVAGLSQDLGRQETGRLDWGGLLRVGLRELRLRPDEFWALTPAELALMMGLDHAPAPMSRDRLADLARLYPDIPASAPVQQEDDMRGDTDGNG
jgi:uncharacterized phage protein (TIGR02216 family)